MKILKRFGNLVRVVQTPFNRGNKSYAQEYGLQFIQGDVFITTDADTLLHPRFVEEVEKSFQDERVAAMTGYVESMRYNWLTACRQLDYVLAQNLHKIAQSNLRTIFVIPGCAGAFRTATFKKWISFDHDTLTEDLDFTYKLHKAGLRRVYNRRAVVFTQDPSNLVSYIKQMRRWYGGAWQNLIKHRDVLMHPTDAIELSLNYGEGLMFCGLLLFVPLINLAMLKSFVILYPLYALFLGGYAAIDRKRLDLFFYAPLYPIVTTLNAFIFLEEFIKEVVFRRRSLIWFKPERREIT